MDHTTYRNPHGLTEPGHRSTAADLAKLAHAALQLPDFRGMWRRDSTDIRCAAREGTSAT